jgi:hypothetical protein
MPTSINSKDPVTLYVPCSFNYRAIDGIILRLEEGGEKDKALLFPLQITIAKSHTNSEESFFNYQWDEWKRILQDFDIEVTFLWITTKESSETEVPERFHSLRNGEKKEVNPAYTRRNIKLEDVDMDLWKRYEAALRKGESKGQRSAQGTKRPDGPSAAAGDKRGVYEKLRVRQLDKILKSRGLSCDGKKDDKIDRLVKSDETRGAT